MVREGIREALEDALGVFLLLRVGQVHRREDLVEDDLADERVELGVRNALRDLRKALLEPEIDHRRVRRVEEAHLARAVGLHVGRVDDVDARLPERQLPLEVEAGRRLDHEEVERFAADEHLVPLAELLLVARGGLGIGTARDDAVDERRAEDAVVPDVGLERGVRRVGQMLQDALLEIVAVVLDQFARDEDKSGKPCGVTRLQQAEDLRRERVLALHVLDARLRRIRDDEAERRQRRVLLEIRREVDALHGRDLLDLLHRLAADHAPKARVVLAAARVQDLRRHAQLVANRLDDLHLAVEAGPVVHLLNHPVDETAQEVALAELKNLRFHHFTFLTFSPPFPCAESCTACRADSDSSRLLQPRCSPTSQAASGSGP